MLERIAVYLSILIFLAVVGLTVWLNLWGEK